MGHIVELTGTDHLDYETFFSHGIPEGVKDDEWRKIIGNRAWGLMHGVVDHFPCETCRESGQVLLSGIHDMVNISTGKGVFDEERWRKFLSMVHEAHQKNASAKHFKHERVAEPSEFSPESFRTVKQGKHTVVVGCPTGHYHGGSCDVGTKAQAILHPLRDT